MVATKKKERENKNKEIKKALLRKNVKEPFLTNNKNPLLRSKNNLVQKTRRNAFLASTNSSMTVF